MPIKTCANPNCKKEFRTLFSNRKYCTLGCRFRYHDEQKCIKNKKPAHCRVCGKPYDQIKRGWGVRTCCDRCDLKMKNMAKQRRKKR